MTDKQIIIDNIDVSGCKYYLFREQQPKGERCCGMGLVDCNNNDCLYKKYKRKEQECERLMSNLTEIKEIAEICKCHNTDGCYECKYFDDCEVEDEEIPTRDVCKLILQKISECEVE